MSSNADKKGREFSRDSYKKRNNKYKNKAKRDNTTDDRNNRREERSTTNDISWYMANPQLVQDAARIPFGNQLGRKFDGINLQYGSTVPGLCAIYAVPGPGIAESVTDAVNISATNVFQFIRKNLSTYASYAAADVMMYIMAVDELYAMYNTIARIFGIANNFSAYNLYYPKALLNAHGFDEVAIQELRENMNDYRSQFNSLIYKAASIYMPVDISIVKRHMWMFGNYFMDAESPKAQTYMYVPAGYHMLDETSSDNGTMLKYYAFDRDENSMGELLDVFNNMIESIRNSDSMLKIAADMRRAYENSQSWTLAYIPENFVVLPVVDHMVLSQIMNSVIHPEEFNSNFNFDITQSVEHNKILYKPTGTLPGTTSGGEKLIAESFAAFAESDGVIINFFKPEVTVEDIVESTRNISLFQVNGEDYTATFYTSGADILVGARIFFKTVDGTGDYEFDHHNMHSYFKTTSSTILTTFLHSFNWAPNLYLLTPGTLVSPTPFIAFDNYTQVAGPTVKRLNEAVLTSMWQVPDFKLPTSGK